MSKLVCCVTIAGLILLAAADGHAAESRGVITGMGDKIVRGVVNIFTGWIEIPVQTHKGYVRGYSGSGENKIMGGCMGFLNGIWHGVGRTLSGGADLATFWAADPADNKGVGFPLEGEYAWSEGTPRSITTPGFGEAVVYPIGGKLVRGIFNGCFGFLEFPGQIVNGFKTKAPDLGIIKGLWFWYSRSADGVCDIATALTPNPEDTKGYPFDGKWPWTTLAESLK